MMRYTLVFFIGFLLLFFTGCKPTQEASSTIEKIEDMNEPMGKGLLYALPKTELFFTVKMVRTTVVPGPYNEYGEELLGLVQVPHQLNSYWEIDNIGIEEFSTVDYDHLYAIQPEGKFSLRKTNFTRKGWIMPLDDNFKEISRSDFYHKKDYFDDIHYKDLSVKKFSGKETRTVYKSVWKDSLYAKVPVEESYTLKKGLDQKAREAASFIFMIREKRFELIAGMGDYYPEGTALRAALNEMDELEERYLDLFTGTKFRDTLEYTLHWSPSKKNLMEPDILFRFSANEGIIQPDVQKGSPLWIEFYSLADTRKLEEFVNSGKMDSEKLDFYYRVPATTLVSLKLADRTIAKKYLEIYQYGSVIRIPYEFLNDQQIIEFYKTPEE